MATTAPTDSHVPPDPYAYLVGAVHPNTNDCATFEFKRGDPDHTGGGYPRWRSYEYRPETPGERKEDVYVPVHRLCAIAWLFEDGVTAADILGDGRLDGVDVHHRLGMPAANVESELEIRDHGEHSSITQAQVRAWGEDAKRRARDDGPESPDRCGRCHDDAGPFWECDDYDGLRCTECAKRDSDGSALEAV